MTGGRPRKRARDTSGLQNQHHPRVPVTNEGDESGPESGPEQGMDHDACSHDEDEEDDIVEEASPWEDLDNEEALEKLVELTIDRGDDRDWVPDMNCKKKKSRLNGVFRHFCHSSTGN
jgi:hypothetical protein